jgi:cytoskeletal protein CcmA (bactofilin family)
MPNSRRHKELDDAVRSLGLPEKERDLALSGIEKMNDQEAASFLSDFVEIKRLVPLVTKASEQTALLQRARQVAKMAQRGDDARKLIVGPEITVSGEITACDRLVVEGTVYANVANCQSIDIAEGGRFAGAASVQEAVIRGRFEGTLLVRGHLLIRATGKVVGTIRYGQIEMEVGAQIGGDIQYAEAVEEEEEEEEEGGGLHSNIVA